MVPRSSSSSSPIACSPYYHRRLTPCWGPLDALWALLVRIQRLTQVVSPPPPVAHSTSGTFFFNYPDLSSLTPPVAAVVSSAVLPSLIFLSFFEVHMCRTPQSALPCYSFPQVGGLRHVPLFPSIVSLSVNKTGCHHLCAFGLLFSFFGSLLWTLCGAVLSLRAGTRNPQHDAATWSSYVKKL
ncbi:hypothetical protein JVT61DRAFT_7176 [Boletus reticuloceps]|uniref:Uncharacterized protein n=1 Tax=Boletus reticuloceps TaxID=495285 RepID=A0A8I2YJ92_9AGAM|nr:hypothetical protein JVT61DRAFT_7176 [Boletus reticuloceps]